MKIEFSYFQCKDGRYAISNVLPEHMIKNEEKGIWVPDDSKWNIEDAYYRKEAPERMYSFCVNPDQVSDYRVKSRNESYEPFNWCQLLDLSDVPRPKWEDKFPILVILDITPKTSYCIYD